MIITENLTIVGKDFTKKYSDKNVYIENESGQQYAEAIDVENAPYTYTETDIPIDVEPSPIDEDVVQKSDAFDYLTGRSVADD